MFPNHSLLDLSAEQGIPISESNEESLKMLTIQDGMVEVFSSREEKYFYPNCLIRCYPITNLH